MAGSEVDFDLLFVGLGGKAEVVPKWKREGLQMPLATVGFIKMLSHIRKLMLFSIACKIVIYPNIDKKKILDIVSRVTRNLKYQKPMYSNYNSEKKILCLLISYTTKALLMNLKKLHICE